MGDMRHEMGDRKYETVDISITSYLIGLNLNIY